MCGITGIFSKKKFASSIIRSMNDSIHHRGPDDEGYLLGGDHGPETNLPNCDYTNCSFFLAFGHKRLAIVDLSPLGHQPMSYLDRYWIVYNGEVYNYIELRDELESLGYTFTSHSDTEVILASFDAWGSKCLERFNGMWAFVIYDRKQEQIFISRDRFGIKPLYYYQDHENFIFGSEIKALLQNPVVPREPNLDYCKMFLKEGSREFLRETSFRDIFQFDNACYIQCDIRDLFKPIREMKYWNLKPNLSEERYDEEKAGIYAKKYFQLLDDAVRLRLRADVKVGSALSGGLDSTSIVYLINQQLHAQGQTERQETFSSVYKTKGSEKCNESKYIDEAVGMFNIKSNQIEPKIEDILNEHRKFVYYLDNPATSTLMSSWHTYKLTKQHGVTVTLDGQGADEQLAGYAGYLLYYFANAPFSTLLNEILLHRDIQGAMPFFIQGALLNIARRIFGRNITVFLLRSAGKRFAYQPLNQVLCNDLGLALETWFHFADRGSMAFSVECRMPFMDYRLVEFLASVPSSYKIHGGWTKYIARLAFNRRLPDNICWRRDKMGWPVPEDLWFRTGLKDHFISTLTNATFLPECGIVFSEKENIFQNRSFDFLLRCYLLEIWHEVFWREDFSMKLPA